MKNIKKILSVAAASLMFMSVLPVNADEVQTPDPAESTAGSEEADFDDTDSDASDSGLEVDGDLDEPYFLKVNTGTTQLYLYLGEGSDTNPGLSSNIPSNLISKYTWSIVNGYLVNYIGNRCYVLTTDSYSTTVQASMFINTPSKKAADHYQEITEAINHLAYYDDVIPLKLQNDGSLLVQDRHGESLKIVYRNGRLEVPDRSALYTGGSAITISTETAHNPSSVNIKTGYYYFCIKNATTDAKYLTCDENKELNTGYNKYYYGCKLSETPVKLYCEVNNGQISIYSDESKSTVIGAWSNFWANGMAATRVEQIAPFTSSEDSSSTTKTFTATALTGADEGTFTLKSTNSSLTYISNTGFMYNGSSNPAKFELVSSTDCAIKVKMTDYTGADTTAAGSYTTDPKDLQKVDSGTKITIAVTPAAGYTVDSVTDAKSLGNNKYEYTATKDATVDIRMKISAVPMLEKGSEFNADLTALAGGAANIKSIVWESTAPGSVTKRDVAAKNVSADNKSTTTGPIWAWYTSDGTIHLYNASGKSKVYMNFDSSGMFKGFSSLPSIDIYDLDGTYLTDSSNLFAGCSSLTAIRLNKTFKFTNAGGGTPNQNEVTPSGLADASYPAEDGNKFWHKASEITVSTNLGKIAVSALEALDKDTIMKMGVSEAEYNKIFDSNGKVRSNYTSNYMLDMQGAIGFEHLFNQTPASMEGTWYSGKATDHRFWKIEGVANVNNMTEIHHPEAPFTTYCWAQHRGPNSGWYDRFEVTNEDEMIANLKVYHQWYQPLPKEKNSSAPMMRSFITVMYYGDITSESQITDSHIRSLWHQMTPQQRADSTFTCVQYCSDSSNYYFRSEADTGDRDGNGIQDAVEVHNWILNQSFNSIPNHDKIHFYIYLSAHKGGGEQQMGIESLQTDYYGGVEIRKVDGNGNPVQGAEFTIYDNSGKSVQTITSDADGIAESCKMDAVDGLKVTGSDEYYTVKETKVPKGYTGTKDVFKFKVYANTVTKIGWRNNSTTQESIKFVNKSVYPDPPVYLRLNKQSTGGKKLTGAKFNIYADEEIRSNGSIVYQKNELVTTVVTNYNGEAIVQLLHSGRYRISEAAAPGGYAKAADQVTNVTSQSSVTFTDSPKQGKYTIKAQKNLPSGFGIKKDQFSFQLWYADGTVSSSGSLNGSPVKGYLTKDVNGNGLYDAGEDEFRIATADENGVPRVNLVAGCNSSGLAVFPEMTYSSENDSNFKGEVHYMISEVKPSGAADSKYSYDSHRESVLGTVSDDGSDTLKVMLMYQPEISDGTEANYTAGQFNNGIKEGPPVIPDPQKTVLGGKHTITANLHNEVWQSENYQYEVSQQIPAEKQRYYFSSMHMEDTLPKGIRLNSLKVYAVKNGNKTDVTSSWKITTTGDKSKKDSQYKVSADCADKAFWNDASHYGVTYVFHFEVAETMEVHRRTSVYNHAKVDITYADPESSIVMKQKTDANGALVKDADGNQLYVPVTSADGKVQYETENPYDNGDGLSHVGNAGVLINSGTVNENASNSHFSTKTTTDKTKAVHSRTTNEVITDIDPLINLPNSGGRGAVKMAVIAAGVMLAVFFAIRHYRQSRESAK